MGNCSTDNVKQSSLSASNQGMVADLRMTSYRQEGSSTQMFNYNSQKFHKYTYHIIDDCLVLKTENDKKHMKPTSEFICNQQSSKNALFFVERRHNYFKIMPFGIENNETLIQKSLWFVVRSAPQKKHHIREKDIVKIGRQKIKIREIILENHHLHNAVIDLGHLNTKQKVYNYSRFIDEGQIQSNEGEITSILSQSEYSCRICLQPGQTTNPLISPCNCIGTVRYVHIKCLRAWLDTHLNIQKLQNCVMVKWTPMSCEVCGSHFKYRVILDNVKYYTLQIPRPEKPYIVLEAVGSTAEYSKIFYFLSFSQKKVMALGRGKAADIHIRDPTVSRHHASIAYHEIQKKFYISDNHSKYGTFVYIKKNMIINPHQKHIGFQIGGQLFSFQAIRRSEPFSEFHQEQRYLNVIEKGSEDCVTSESSEAEEEKEQIQDEISSEQQQELAQEEQLKMVNNISNISSLPTSNNIAEQYQ